MALRSRSESVTCYAVFLLATLYSAAARQLQQGPGVPVSSHHHHPRRTDAHGKYDVRSRCPQFNVKAVYLNSCMIEIKTLFTILESWARAADCSSNCGHRRKPVFKRCSLQDRRSRCREGAKGMDGYVFHHTTLCSTETLAAKGSEVLGGGHIKMLVPYSASTVASHLCQNAAFGQPTRGG